MNILCILRNLYGVCGLGTAMAKTVLRLVEVSYVHTRMVFEKA